MRFLVDMRGADVDDRQVKYLQPSLDASPLIISHYFSFITVFFFNNFTEQLRDDLMTMLIAGHETTAAVLTWAIFLLAQVCFNFCIQIPRVIL